MLRHFTHTGEFPDLHVPGNLCEMLHGFFDQEDFLKTEANCPDGVIRSPGGFS